MKRLFLSVFLLVSISTFSQVDNSDQFVEFAISSATEQQMFMINSDWLRTAPKTWVENGIIYEQHEYGKKINGVPYMLRLLYGIDKDRNQATSVKVIFTDATTYARWILSLRTQGYIFKEREKGKFEAIEQDYSIYYSKKSSKTLTIYEFEITTYQQSF